MSKLFYRRMDTVGDGSGINNMAVDGSITPVIFRIKTESGETIKLARIIMYVEDTGTFDADKWGNGITLTNGFEFRRIDNAEVTNTLGVNVKSSGEMASLCHDINHEAFGTGNEFISFRLTFTKAGITIDLFGDDDEFQLVVNDDMTNLVKMYVHAQGISG